MNQEQRIIAAALAQAKSLREKYGQPQVINLSNYATDEDLRHHRRR